MTIENLRDGLTILIDAGAVGYCVSAGNDELYAGLPGDATLPVEAAEKLEGLGWFWDEYQESWGAFT